MLFSIKGEKSMSEIGFIGMGNMAQALAKGLIQSGKISRKNIFAYAPTQETLIQNSEYIGFTAVSTLKELVQKCQILVVACKPHQIPDMLKEAQEDLKGKVLLSVASGWVHETYHKILGNDVRIQCIMSNTPVTVGEGVLIFEEENSLQDQERTDIFDLFSALGIVEELPTYLMSIGGVITGCIPAFMDLIMESYADAAVAYGIQRADAYRLISQAMLGSAKLQQATGSHPAILKDAVCSPNGSTIHGVNSLEHSGIRSACINSIDAIMKWKNENK